MADIKGITIELGLSDKSVQKLRAIAKHAKALADELKHIDNAWQCDCGSLDYLDSTFYGDEEPKHSVRECTNCHEQYAIPNEELPTSLEGSD